MINAVAERFSRAKKSNEVSHRPIRQEVMLVQKFLIRSSASIIKASPWIK